MGFVVRKALYHPLSVRTNDSVRGKKRSKENTVVLDTKFISTNIVDGWLVWKIIVLSYMFVTRIELEYELLLTVMRKRWRLSLDNYITKLPEATTSLSKNHWKRNVLIFRCFPIVVLFFQIKEIMESVLSDKNKYICKRRYFWSISDSLIQLIWKVLWAVQIQTGLWLLIIV